MRTRLLMSATASILLLLSGCNTLKTLGEGNAVDVPGAAQKAYTLQVKGEMLFQCDWDEKGPYWRFIKPRGKLYANNKVVASLESDFGIVHNDGSKVKAKIVAQGTAADADSLRDALFEVTPLSSKGRLANIRWIQRLSAEGGMPVAACSASQRNLQRQFPFTAKYVFWR